MIFYTGSPKANWLWRYKGPWCVSRRTLHTVKTLKPSKSPWVLDSGGFTEVSTHGRWTLDPRQYAKEARRFYDEVGKLEWCAIQDWMCEAWILKKTGLTVEEHQTRTVQSYLDLKAIDPDLPWLPVLQGHTPEEYLEHIDMYRAQGIELTEFPTVGIGSVCRRQGTVPIVRVIRRIAEQGIRLHGFGVKLTAFSKPGMLESLVSADSMAWSLEARNFMHPLPFCTHKTCASCVRYAVIWRDKVQAILEGRKRSCLLPLRAEERTFNEARRKWLEPLICRETRKRLRRL